MVTVRITGDTPSPWGQLYHEGDHMVETVAEARQLVALGGEVTVDPYNLMVQAEASEDEAGVLTSGDLQEPEEADESEDDESNDDDDDEGKADDEGDAAPPLGSEQPADATRLRGKRRK